MSVGERILAGVFGLFGAFWIAQALGLRYWGDFAPGPGFLPLWLGITLVALVTIHFLTSRRRAPADEAAEASPRLGRIAAIVAGFVACIAIIEWLGFAASVAAYLVFLLGAVERQRPAVVAGVTIGTTVTLHLIFRTWLGVPLPEGPWGF
jgi:putative tricarboxylic transport membrane protein